MDPSGRPERGSALGIGGEEELSIMGPVGRNEAAVEREGIGY